MPSVLVLVDSVPAADPANPESPPPPEFGVVLDLACAVAAASGGNVRVLSVIEAPPDESLSTSALDAQVRRKTIAAWNRAWADAYRAGLAADETLEPGRDPLPDIQPVVSVAIAGNYWTEVADAAHVHECSMFIAANAPGAPVDGMALLQHELACDSAVLRPPHPAAGQALPALLGQPRILLPARGGPHASLALRIAGALRVEREGELSLLHVLQQDMPERQRAREERPFTALLNQAGLPPDTKQVWAVGRSVPEVIMQQAKGYDLILLGAPVAGRGSEFSLGRVASSILKNADATVVVVKTAGSAEPALRAQLAARSQDGDLAPEALSLVVDKWFAENTFNSEEYADLDQLLELKRQRGLTISLGLPTLNEEATIGEIITVLKTALMDEVPLLDEMVVIDSESTDRTVEIARELGVPVFVHQQVLPEAGPPLRGKGEALWKSLHVLKGDLIAWVDTDVANMHPRFVYGLIGPLLREPRIAYVKGYYHRPIKIGDTLQHEGGGRVTELTIRPLFNLFFPLLSGLVQPLAGEYAGRREVLERLPFFSGYGVETGLLIDLLEEYGLSAIGQVSLGERVHRNQSLANLSLMAFALVQVILSRLEEHARVRFIQDVNRSMKLIRFAPGQLSLDLRDIRDVERPPIRTIPAYRRARARNKVD
ncbi:MAG TPA: glucosyl-3-phosphoglycerate synthase [Chloroflexia bacterium]|nr:glucosyl-3-phosphoglycerate synthase [Chloroflexia bacterium]